ncbi:MAG TPA: hypothetical protein VII06_41555 [Chloroflexota bacterium]
MNLTDGASGRGRPDLVARSGDLKRALLDFARRSRFARPYANFGAVAETFAHPERTAQRRYRQAVLGYLKESSISPLPLRRLAERDPERASRVFQRVLKQPDFSWERDGEALLRRYKASYFERPALPSVTPISEALARAQIAASNVGAAPSERRGPGRRAHAGPRRR